MSGTVTLIKNLRLGRPLSLEKGLIVVILLNKHILKLPSKYLCLYP